MFFRPRPARPRLRFDLETLESRTLLSSGFGTMAEALFATSYASLHLRPVMTSTASPPKASAIDGAAGSGPLTRVARAAPPVFLEPLVVDVNPDGLSGALVRYQANELGTFAATARWDGGPAEIALIDQPGENNNGVGVGAVYLLHDPLPVGTHTLEVTVTNVDRRVSATTSATFTITSVQPSEQNSVVAVPNAFASPDAAVTDPGVNAALVSEAPTVTGVFVAGAAWTPAFKNYLATQGLGDAARGFAIPATDQLNELPWTNLDQISVRFSEDVTATQSDLLVKGATTADYAINGFAYDAATFTATWTLAQALPTDKLLLHVTNFVIDVDGNRLDGEWTNGADTFPSGDAIPDGVFQFRANVLAGDADRSGRINTIDISRIKARENRSTTDPGAPGTATYTIFDDLDGDGVITGDPGDLGLAKAQLNMVLPANEPTAPGFAATPSGLLAAAASENRINLSWTDNAVDETGFLIEMSLDGTAYHELTIIGAAVGTGTASYSFTEALSNTTQHFRVAALNAAGHSPFSNSASALPNPAPPEGLAVESVTASAIVLSWDVVDGLNGFDLERKAGAGLWSLRTTTSGATGTFTDSGLDANTLYEYRLYARNSTGSSNAGASEAVYTLAAAPSGLTAAATSVSSIELRWADTSGGGADFVVEGQPAGGAWRTFAEVATGTTVLTLANLVGGLGYSYVVRARNESGLSDASNIAAATPRLEQVGSWNIVAFPTSATRVSGESYYWANKVNSQPSMTEAFANRDVLAPGSTSAAASLNSISGTSRSLTGLETTWSFSISNGVPTPTPCQPTTMASRRNPRRCWAALASLESTTRMPIRRGHCSPSPPAAWI